MKHTCLTCKGIDSKRRDFLRIGSLSLLGITWSQYFGFQQAMAATGDSAGKTAKAKACILVDLEGGPSHMDTWDSKPTSNFKPIATNVAGIQISELFPGIALRMDKLAIIRSMHGEENNHPQAFYYMMTGHRPNSVTKFPSLGSIIAKESGSSGDVPAYTMVPRPWESFPFDYNDTYKSAFLGPEFNPMVLPDPSQKDFVIPDLTLPKAISTDVIDDRRLFLREVDLRYRKLEQAAEFAKMDAALEQAMAMILSPTVKKAFDMSQESQKTRDAYGRNRFGQSVLLARRLVEHGCRFVTAAGYKTAQWDTHAKNDEEVRDRLAPPLDQALSALLDDLDQRGLLESTLVLVMGEFGRTVDINPNKGRDHWCDCWSVMLGGGGIHGGQVIGSSDEKGAYVTDAKTSVGDLFATVYKAMGIDWTKTYMTPIGRPIYIAKSFGDQVGAPISRLFGSG